MVWRRRLSEQPHLVERAHDDRGTSKREHAGSNDGRVPQDDSDTASKPDSALEQATRMEKDEPNRGQGGRQSNAEGEHEYQPETNSPQRDRTE